MVASDQDISDLYREFKEGSSKEFSEERRNKKQFFQKKLAQDKISKLREGDVREIVRELWSFEMWTNKDYLVEEITKEGLEQLREKLSKFLYEQPSKGHTFDKIVENVRMMGPASASEILTCLFPEECGIWNKKAREGLKKLGFGDELPIEKKKIDGEQYQQFNQALLQVKERIEDDGFEVEDLLEIDYFLYFFVEKSSEQEEEEKIEDFSHSEMIDTLLEIGDGLGFDVDKEYQAGPGARIDVRWSTKVANLGRIAYAFEVQRKGSRDSAILNLQKARNADPSLQKLVIVSTQDQLKRFKDEIGALDERFRKFVSYISVEKIYQAEENLSDLKDFLREAGLKENIG